MCDIADQLERASQDLDILIHDARIGIQSARQFDSLEERAQAIAAQLVAAFRGAREPSVPVRVTRIGAGRATVWA